MYWEASESWLKNCIGLDFDVDKYLSESAQPKNGRSYTQVKYYSMSLAQQCEYALFRRLSESLSDNDRLRLVANSGPTQTWVTALPLSWKNWNLTSKEWIIAARRRLGLDVRAKRTRCSNCRFHEIGLRGDHAIRCSGKMGSKMRHDALKILLARAFKQENLELKWSKAGVYSTKGGQGTWKFRIGLS